jgi:uncharacterized protein (TIGR02118 family)
MVMISFIYPDAKGARFDEAYYVQKHLSRVRELWAPLGLESVTPLVRIDGNQESGPFRAVSMLRFASLEHYQHALANGGAELLADVANFTDIKPFPQISKEL